MLDSGSMSELSLRPVAHVKVVDINEIHSKFYKFGELLGRGAFGTVMKATEIKTGICWAIKIINKAQSGAMRLKLLEREINILRVVNHPHIIHLERFLESSNALFLVFELCDGELRQIFQKKKVFTEEETRTVVASLSSAVSYLHRNDIVHRDLKLENILVTTNPNDPEDKLFIKVTDFGLSVVRGGVGPETMLQELCGTPAYMSPELFGERMYTQQCDVWAMGVIMYLLLTGNYPFEARAGKTLAQIVQSEEPNYDIDPLKGKENTSSVKLLRKMLEKNPAYRATAREVESDPWTRGSQSEEPPAKNAMELMRMLRQDMRQTSFPEFEQRKSMRRISVLMDTMRTSARVSDERTRNMAIRRTFGEVAPTVASLDPRARLSPTSDSQIFAGESKEVENGAKKACGVAPNGAAPVATVVTVATADTAAGAMAGPAAGAGVGTGPGAIRVRAVVPRKKGPSVAGEVKARLKPRPVAKASWEMLPRSPAFLTGKPGAYGIVARERNKAFPDNGSSTLLMPADHAPPIIYYERNVNQSKPHRKKQPTGAHHYQKS